MGGGGENNEVGDSPNDFSTAIGSTSSTSLPIDYADRSGEWEGSISASAASSSSSGTLTYWQEKYGGDGGSSSSGPPLDVDAASVLPSTTEVDRALAIFKLIVSLLFVVLGIYALVRFYRSRWILDIRTRSVHLVMMAGASIAVSYLVAINGSLYILFGPDYALRWLWSSLLLFFITPGFFGSYVCRAIRLAVVFHPRARRSLPWLVPEKNHVYLLMLMNFGFLAIPIHDEYTSMVVWEAIHKQVGILAVTSLVFGGILLCIYPFIRKVDDLFNISTELAVVSALLIVYAVGQECVYHYGGEGTMRWIGDFLPFVVSAAVFGVSVVDPQIRLAFGHLAASKRNAANRVLLNVVRENRVTAASSGFSSSVGNSSEDEGAAKGRFKTNSIQRRRGNGVDAASAEETWNFERLASTPLLAAAFEDYARKALCHESVLFLSEVARYQEENYLDPSDTPFPSQYASFCRITDTFIKAGSCEEVNISDADKTRLVNLAQKDRERFERMDVDERRWVFTQAYVEVKGMLEANLLLRFLQTDQFKTLRAQRDNVNAMLMSPL